MNVQVSGVTRGSDDYARVRRRGIVITATIAAFMLAMIGCLMNAGTAYAAGGTLSGAGTAESPYLVEDAADLVAVSTFVNDNSEYRDKCYKMTTDIDMASVASFTPIGSTSSTAFAGTFDGDGHRIDNITIETSSGIAALFGSVEGESAENRAVIKGVTLSGTVKSTASYSSYAGGIVGRADDNVLVQNCANEATVSAANSAYAGGIVGYMLSGYWVTVDSCRNSGAISANPSYNSSNANVGGIVGMLYYSTSSTEVPTIRNCYNTGSVTAARGYGAGGIAGTFSNSTSSWNKAYMTIENCYSTGAVTLNDVSATYVNRFGAIVGHFANPTTANNVDTSRIENCYWLDTSCTQAFPALAAGQCATVNVTSKTEDEMKAGSFVSDLNAGGDAWQRGAVYPVLSWEIDPGAPRIDTDLSTDLVEYDQNDTTVQPLTIAAVLPGTGLIGDGGTLTYQWYQTATGAAEDATAIAGQTGSTFTPPVSTTGEFYYFCTVTNTWTGEGADLSPKSAQSSIAHIVVHSTTSAATPAITTQPATLEKVAQDAPANLSLEASVTGEGAGRLVYQWYSCDSAAKDNPQAIESANEASYVPDTTAVGTRYYYCTVTNVFEATKTASVDSNVVSVTVAAVEIATAADLKALSDRVAGGDNCEGKNFLVTADIDLQSDETTKEWVPIGDDDDSDSAFCGIFDGGGHTISGLSITGTDSYVGLFGGICTPAVLKNVTVDGTVSGDDYVGGLSGSTMGDITLENVGSTVDVSATGSNVGGLVGAVQGYSFTANLDKCYSRGTVASSYSSPSIGGLVGYLSAGYTNVNHCYSTAKVTADGGYVGGLYGQSSTTTTGGRMVTISNSYAAGPISASAATSNMGKFGGNATTSVPTFSNCYCPSDDPGYPTTGGTASTAITTPSGAEMRDSAFLDQLSPDDAYAFDAAKVNGGYPILMAEYREGTPVISQNPEGGQIARNGDMTLSVTAAAPEGAEGTLTYQWYRNDTGSTQTAESALIEGATAATYKVPTGATDTGITHFFCVVTNTFGQDRTASAVSDSAQVTVLSAVDAAVPQIASLTGDVSYAPGDVASDIAIKASLPAEGAGTLTYQWYEATTRSNDVSQASPIEGATGDTYVPATDRSGARYYFCEVTNTFEDVKSAKAVSLPVAITVGSVKISTPEELAEVSEAVAGGTNYEGVTLELVNDIDLSSYSAWQPIGGSSSVAHFKGTFEGNGYTVSGLSVVGSSTYRGLFGNIEDAAVRDLRVEGTVTGSNYVAGVIGNAVASEISNVSFSGSVTGTGSYTGGIVASAQSCTMSDLLCEGDVKGGGSYVGGLVGYMQGSAADGGSTLTGSANTAAVTNTLATTSSASAGGLVGQLASGSTGYVNSITSCKNSGAVTSNSTATSDYASVGTGGLVGIFSYGNSTEASVLSDCYNVGKVHTNSFNAGGLVGRWYNYTSSLSAISNCYNAGAVSAGTTSASLAGYYGGLFGRTYQTSASATAKTTLDNCYSMEVSTVDSTTMGCDRLYPAAFTATPTSVAQITLAQAQGTDDIIIDATQHSLLDRLNVGATPGAFKADSASDQINQGFPVLIWESASSSTVYVDIPVTVEPADADVTITGADGHNYTTYTTNANDERVYHLPVGDYTWKASAFSYLASNGSFSVVDDQSTAAITLLEAPRFEVSLAVTTDDGTPFTGEVSLTNATLGEVTLTDGKATVPVGDYSYTASMNGYISQTGTVKVLDADVPVDVVLQRDSVWTGTTQEPADKTFDAVNGYWNINIYTPSELAWVAQQASTSTTNAEYGNAHVTLKNDLKMNEDGSQANEWAPIGSVMYPFSGVFDGGGNRVSNISIATPTMYGAFFGSVGKAGATVEIKNLVIDGSIVANMYGAGLVGNAASGVYNLSITDCGNECDVTAQSTTGTLANAGGILGHPMSTASGSDVATISIRGCYNKGDITLEGPSRDTFDCVAGGIVAHDSMTSGSASAFVTLKDCYNTGAITASDAVPTAYLGGIAGYATGVYSLSGCYNAGDVSQRETGVVSGSLLGSFASDYGQVSATSLWLASTSPVAIGGTGIGERDQSTKADAATDITATALGSAYKMPAVGALYNDGLPLLLWETDPISIDDAEIDAQDAEYTGEAIVPAIAVTIGSETLKEGVDYTVAYKNADGETVAPEDLVDLGEYTAVITGIGSYAGETRTSFKITKPISADMVAAIDDQTFTGEAITPEPVVTDGDTVLVKDVDYTVSAYTDNTAIGTAKVTITGKGSYTGSVEASFEIISAYTAIEVADMVTDASLELVAVTPSTDGTDVLTTDTWAPQTVIDAAQAAIDAAREVANDPDSTQAEIQEAAQNLIDAQAALEAATKPGTKAPDTSTAARWTRLGGDNRYGTMQKVVSEGFTSSSTVVLASGQSTADALAASGLAGLLDAPVVLTSADTLSAEASSEINRLGAQKVYIMGGTAAVSGDVERQVKALGIDVERVAGTSRTSTAAEIYKTGAQQSTTWGTTAIVANGWRTADALSISPYSYAKSAPLFLTQADGSLDDDTIARLKKGGFSRIIIVGGTGVVTSTTQQNLADQTGATVSRLGGASRFESSALVAQLGLAEGMSLSNVGVAAGQDQSAPDSLCAGALLGSKNSVLVLVADGSAKSSEQVGITSVIAPKITEVSEGYVFGGTSAVSSTVFERLASLG